MSKANTLEDRLLMTDRGKQVADVFLPGFKLLGVDPGYLFVRYEGNGSIDLPGDIVDHLDRLINVIRTN